MAEPPFSLADASDAELERVLTDLGTEIIYPPTPDLAARVRARLDQAAVAAPPTAPVRGRGCGRIWLAAAAVLLLIISALIAFPDVRTAIADRIGLRGVHIRWIDDLPPAERAPAGATLMLGAPVTLDDARAAVDFAILLPTPEGLGNPPEIYLHGRGDEAMISFVYPASSSLPGTQVAGVGALLTQFRGDVERGFIEKGLMGGDERQTRLETVLVNGEPGFWISGAPHAFFLSCAAGGECREERYRLAGNVLIWEQGDLTLRLESGLSRDASIAIAESMRASE